MNLFLLRHGIAEELGPKNNFNDADRALTSEGVQKLKRIGKAMARMELSFDRILSSPYLRAKQTAMVIAEQMKTTKGIELSDLLVPGGSTRKLIELLSRLQPAVDTVLLVGHEPSLSELASLLVFGEKTSSVVMKKGGLCKLNALSLRHGRCAALELLLTPKQMLLIS